MRYGAFTLFILILLSGFSNVSAEEETFASQGLELDWEYDFGKTFISTKPLIANETLFVRTSTSTSNSAGIYAFDLNGELIWSKMNSNSIFNDMSPITYVEQGQGDCGAWPDMLLVGWSDGTVDALHPGTGSVFWHKETEVVTWGITGSMLVDSDELIVPTRNGLINFCLSNGSTNFEVQTGLGWRNGVSKAGQNYFLGDEAGILWKVSKEGDYSSKFLDIGKIRHAPLVIGDMLLVHGQGVTGSKVALVNPVDFSIEVISNSGPSPGIPILFKSIIITIDSSYINTFDCSTSCQFLDQYPFTSNGESSLVFNEMFMLPRNTVEGGWGIFSINSSGGLRLSELPTSEYDWYGTAGPEYQIIAGREILAIGNDNGNLQVFSSKNVNEPEQDLFESDYISQIGTFILFILVTTSGIQFLRENYRSSFKYLLIILVALSTFAFNDIFLAWSSYVSEINDDAQSQEALWDESWPEEWLGTQIVIFEFANQSLISGGHVNAKDALELTHKAAVQLDISVEDSDTSIGKYIESFNGVRGEGWIFYVDGSEAMISSEYAEINSDSIVHWKII
jgi:hypothetical protein